jgi:glutathione S-transferase
MLKIYGRANGFNVRKVLWLCEELSITYDREDWGRGYKPTSEPEFQKINPIGRVPVIDDNGFILRESHSILRYLAAKTRAEEYYPSDLKARARVDQWLDWAGSDPQVGMRGVFIGGFIKEEPWNNPWFVKAGEAEYTRLMTLLDAHFAASGNRHIAGSTFTIGDIPVGLIVHRWLSLDLERPSLPALEAYYETLSERPAYLKFGRNGTP